MNNAEAFEAWVMNTSRRVGTHTRKDRNGKYLDNRVDAKWSAWQAALASQVQQDPTVCNDGGKCGAGGYCITCPNVPAPDGDKP